MSKNNRKEQQVNVRMSKSEAKKVTAILEKMNRPHLLVRMSGGIKQGTFATGRFFKESYTGTANVCTSSARSVTNWFKTVENLADSTHETIISLGSVNTKEELVAAATKLEAIASQIRQAANEIYVEKIHEPVQATVITEDTVTQPA